MYFFGCTPPYISRRAFLPKSLGRRLAGLGRRAFRYRSAIRGGGNFRVAMSVNRSRRRGGAAAFILPGAQSFFLVLLVLTAATHLGGRFHWRGTRISGGDSCLRFHWGSSR